MQMCPRCSHNNPDAARFCNMCGTKLIGLLGKGEILHIRYKVTKVLGCGGFGTVYLAEDIQKTNALCAVKGMFDNPDWTDTERVQNIQSFQEEARILRSLSHPNLPKVLDVFADGGKQYFVMEFVAGQNLEDIIDKSTVIGGITESQVMGWMIQICDGLEYLHQNNIIHRDIKPANIRFTPEGQVKLVDFGLAKVFDPSNPKTATMKKAFGTKGYAPLEQYGGGEHTDARSDIYALGATLYYLLVCNPPPDANDRVVNPMVFTPPRQVNTQISANMEQVILKAMAIRKDDRYQTVVEMRDALLGRVASTFPCPKCQTPNPVGTAICLACQSPISGLLLNPFRFKSGKEARTLSELVALIDQYWDEAKTHLYAGNFANWLSGIGRGDLTLEANNIKTSVSNQDEGLEQFVQSTGASPPDVRASETKVDFGQVLQGDTRDKKISIRNAGRGYVIGIVSSAAAWLKVKPNRFSGKQPQQLELTIDTSRLSLGQAIASLTITWNGGKLTIPVTVDVVEQPSVLSLNTTRLNFANISTGAMASRTFDISNTGGSVLQGTISSNASNISVSPRSFSIRRSDSPVTITVTVSATGGSRNVKDSLTVQANAGTQQITCEYIVEEPLISVFPAYLEFGAILRGGKKSQMFTIENNGSGILSGAISSDSPCVTVMPDRFQTSTRQYIAVTASDKNMGEKRGSIHITSNAGAKTVAYSYRTSWLSMSWLLCMVLVPVFVGIFVIGIMQLTKEAPTKVTVKPTSHVSARINLPSFQKIAYGGHPNWSPSTNKVVFHSNIDGDNEIYIMNPDGANKQQITFNDYEDFYPEWSPDGRRIAYCSGKRNHYVIKVMNSDGSDIQTLTSSDYVSGLPSWSKDGSKITYHTDRTGVYTIWSMSANGYGQHQVVAQRSSSPHYSPVDDVIVFESKQNNMWDIWAIDLDGTNLRNLTRSAYTCVSPTWSADGSRILYVCKRSGEEGFWIMNRNGSNPQLLKRITVKYFGGVLSPDGKYLLYTAGEDAENGEMYVERLGQ